MFEEALKQIAVVAVFVERLVNFLKLTKYNDWAKEYQKYIDIALSLGLNVLLCFAWHIDVFAIAGLVVPQALWLGSVLTGVLAGLGSEVIHEAIELLKMWRNGPELPENVG